MRRIEPKQQNFDDAATMERVAAKLRAIWLEIDAASKECSTSYADDAFCETLNAIETAEATLKMAAQTATDNADEDAFGAEADRLRDMREDY